METSEPVDLDQELRVAFETRLQQYAPVSVNRDGANGVVVFATNRVTMQAVAIKFHDSAGGADRHDEPRSLSSVSSPNVLQVLDAGTLSDTLAYFVTPRCSGGSLDSLLHKRLGALPALDLAIQIGSGIAAIHATGFVHRDIKPGNIVVEGDRPLIADFGSVRTIPYTQTSSSTSNHTALYRPPEVEPGIAFTVQGDVYQLGVVTLELLGGKLGRTERELLSGRQLAKLRTIVDPVSSSRYVDECIRNRARRGDLLDISTLPSWICSATRSTVRRMINQDVGRRYHSAGEAVAALHSARNSQGDWHPLPHGAQLRLKNRTLRVVLDTRSGQFVVEQDKGSGFRQVPGRAAYSFDQQIRWVTNTHHRSRE